MAGIKKSFPGVKALKGVSFEAYSGESLAMIGANGAGKSTLMNILGGVVQADEGDIQIDGQKAPIHSPADAARRGIAFVHQELALMPTLSILDNMLISAFPSRNGFIDYRQGEELCREALARLGYDFNLRMQVRDLSPGDQQIIEIARTLLGKSQDRHFRRADLLADVPGKGAAVRDHSLHEIRGHDHHLHHSPSGRDFHDLRKGRDPAQRRKGGAVHGQRPDAERDRGENDRLAGSRRVTSSTTREPGAVLLTVENLKREGYLENGSTSPFTQGEVVGSVGLAGIGAHRAVPRVDGPGPDHGREHPDRPGRRRPSHQAPQRRGTRWA